MNMLLQNLLLLFLFFVVLGLLAKAKLLPLYLYLTVAEFIGPVLKEKAALGALLATAKPLYGPGGYYSQPPAAEAEAEEMEVEPEPGTDEWYDYWCDR